MQNNTHTSAALKKLIEWARTLNIHETIIPSDIDELASLETLILYNLQLTTLPNELSALVNLKNFYLASNSFTELPLVVCKLEKLEVLWIMNNRIKELPNEITNLSKLKELVVFDNDIEAFPNIGFEMQHLEYFNLRSSKLSAEDITTLEKNFKGKCDFSNQKIDAKFRIEPLKIETLSKAKKLRDTVFGDTKEEEKFTLDAAVNKESFKGVYEDNAVNYMKYWVAKNRDDIVIGLIGIYTEPEDDEKSCSLGWFCIDEAYRGLGYGKELLEYAEMEAALLGMEYMHLYIEDTEKFKSTMELYKSKGFIEYVPIRNQAKYDIYLSKKL